MAVSKQVSVFFVLVASVIFVLDATMAQEAQSVVLAAMMLPYDPESINWDMRTVGSFCAPQDADRPMDWLQRYGWAATCGVTPCGYCVQVRNLVTGASAVARVLDKCHSTDGGLELGLSVLEEIDIDGHGYHDDGSYSLDVDFNFIECQDIIKK